MSGWSLSVSFGKFRFCRSSVSTCTSMASDVTMKLFLMTLLLLNSIKTSEKPPFLSIRISSECGALEWKSVKFGVYIQVFKLRSDYSLADMTFLEDMIYLLRNRSFPFSRPTRSYKMDFTPRPMQLILKAAFIYHQHIVF